MRGRGRAGIRFHLRGLALAAVVSGGLWACAGSHAADLERNPREGQFYTNEEIMQLSRSQRDAYCEAMEAYLEELRLETETYNARLDTLDAMSDSLRTKTIEISSEIREVNSELRELRLRRNTITSYTVRPGDTLRSVAKTVYGDALRFRELYEANRDQVAGEDAELTPGTVLQVPRGGR